MVITEFNDNDNIMLVVELVVAFVVDIAMNESTECRTIHSLVLQSSMQILDVGLTKPLSKSQ